MELLSVYEKTDEKIDAVVLAGASTISVIINYQFNEDFIKVEGDYYTPDDYEEVKSELYISDYAFFTMEGESISIDNVDFSFSEVF